MYSSSGDEANGTPRQAPKRGRPRKSEAEKAEAERLRLLKREAEKAEKERLKQQRLAEEAASGVRASGGSAKSGSASKKGARARGLDDLYGNGLHNRGHEDLFFKMAFHYLDYVFHRLGMPAMITSQKNRFRQDFLDMVVHLPPGADYATRVDFFGRYLVNLENHEYQRFSAYQMLYTNNHGPSVGGVDASGAAMAQPGYMIPGLRMDLAAHVSSQFYGNGAATAGDAGAVAAGPSTVRYVSGNTLTSEIAASWIRPRPAANEMLSEEEYSNSMYESVAQHDNEGADESSSFDEDDEDGDDDDDSQEDGGSPKRRRVDEHHADDDFINDPIFSGEFPIPATEEAYMDATAAAPTDGDVFDDIDDEDVRRVVDEVERVGVEIDKHEMQIGHKIIEERTGADQATEPVAAPVSTEPPAEPQPQPSNEATEPATEPQPQPSNETSEPVAAPSNQAQAKATKPVAAPREEDYRSDFDDYKEELYSIADDLKTIKLGDTHYWWLPADNRVFGYDLFAWMGTLDLVSQKIVFREKPKAR